MKNLKFTLLSFISVFAFSCTNVTETGKVDCFYRHLVFNTGYNRLIDPFNSDIFGDDGSVDTKWQVSIGSLAQDEHGTVTYAPPSTFPTAYPNTQWLLARYPFAGGGRDHVYYYTFCLSEGEYNSIDKDISLQIRGYILDPQGGNGFMPAVQEISINNASIYNHTASTYPPSVTVSIPKRSLVYNDINVLKIELNTNARSIFQGSALNVSGYYTVLNCCN